MESEIERFLENLPLDIQVLLERFCAISVGEGSIVLAINSSPAIKTFITAKREQLDSAALKAGLAGVLFSDSEPSRFYSLRIKLTQQQQTALKKMLQFLDADEQLFLLQGYAGTGKTTCIQEFIGWLMEQYRVYVAMAAPTNKAVKVLRCMGSTWGLYNVDFLTIHQLLGLTVEIDDFGNQILRQKNPPSFDKYDLIVIDECSMIDSELWGWIQRTLEKCDTKIILMGDPAQLPPVGEVASPAFQVSTGVTLTEVVRQASGNPLLELVERARTFAATSRPWKPSHSTFTPDKTQGFWLLDNRTWMGALSRVFKSKEARENPDYVRALAWTNEKVDALNQFIRRSIYGDTCPRFVEGERLIAKSPVFAEDGETIVLATSSECRVLDVQVTIREKYKVWALYVEDDVNQKHWLYVLHESAVNKYRYDCQKLRDKATVGNKFFSDMEARLLWKNYYAHLRLFAPMDYAYAMTVHKSQGSTFDNVMIVGEDVAKNQHVRERNQCLYVACSRARERVLISM